MKKLFYISIFLFSLQSFAQAGPPPVGYPTEENKILIDKLMETTELKRYIYNYCIDRINLASRLEKWDENKKNEIIKSIHLEKMDDAVHDRHCTAKIHYQEIKPIKLLFSSKKHTFSNRSVFRTVFILKIY